MLFILSPDWWNEYGIVFTKVKPLIINKEKWGNIMFKLCQIALVEDNKFTFESEEVQLAQQNSLGKPLLSDRYESYRGHI